MGTGERPPNMPVLDLQALGKGLDNMRDAIVQEHNYVAGFEFLTDALVVLARRVAAHEEAIWPTSDGEEGDG